MSLAEVLRSLLSVFLASFVGHFSIILKDIIFIPIFIYASQFSHPLWLGFMGGLGGGLGELSAYLIGRGIFKLAGNKVDKAKIPSWVETLGLFSVLVFSLTPIPDAPLLMLLGSARFPVLAVLALEIVGKTVLYSIVAVGGGVFYSLLAGILPFPWDSALTILASMSLSIVFSLERTRKPIFGFARTIFNKVRQQRRKEKESSS